MVWGRLAGESESGSEVKEVESRGERFGRSPKHSTQRLPIGRKIS